MSAFRANNGITRRLARARGELARAAERGMEDALREFVETVIHEPPTPPLDTGWLRDSTAIFVNGTQSNATEYEAARQAAAAAARTHSRTIVGSKPPAMPGGVTPGIVRGYVVMTAAYARRMNYAFQAPGGPRSRLDPRINAFFFSGKILAFRARILEPLRRRMREFAKGRTINYE